MGGEIVLHRLNHRAEEFIGNIGNNEPHRFFLSRAEAAGRSVRRIAQFCNGLIHLLFRLAGNITGIIDGVGDRSGGNAGQPGNVTDGYFHSSTVLCANTILFCVIH